MFFLGLILTGCHSDFEFNDNELKNEVKIDQSTPLIDESIINAMNISEESKKWSIDLYNSRDNHMIWLKYDGFTSEILSFFKYVNSDTSLNIPFGYFSSPSYDEKASIMEKEVLIALRCAEFLYLKDTTLINYEKNTFNQSQLISTAAFSRFLQEETNIESWISRLLYFSEKNERLVQMHLSLNQFTTNYGVEDIKTQKVPYEIKDSVEAEKFIIEQLLKRNFIKDSTIFGEELKIILKSFQYQNGLNADGEIGRNTINALVETNYSRYLKGVISIDKMREFPDSLMGGKLIVINIPSYLLHLYIENRVINTSRVIVGTIAHQTPLFTSTMQYIVVSPFWNVPYSIASKEILPHLKKDQAYLTKNRYSITDKNQNVLNTDSINWNNYQQSDFPFFVRQDPGPSNSLGLVKLMFPNEKSIYIHDTPSKYLFGRDIRTFSHGCIRTEAPFKLVSDILSSENNKYLDSLDILSSRPKETYLFLEEKFPVTIVYHTAGISDSTQQVLFYNDIYKKEGMLYKLFQRPSQE